jgi:hypothetical protein
LYPLIVDKQQLFKNVAAATNTSKTIDELLDSFILYSGHVVGDYFFPEVLVYPAICTLFFLLLTFFFLSSFLSLKRIQ